MLAHASSGPDDQGSLSPVEQLVDRQEQAYRTLRATIAASCALGHRSCQVLWGPRGSGKHRILRLLAHDVRRTPNTFVIELQGRLLKDDEAALGVIAQQLLSFLQSPQSAQLRAVHYLLRTGTFGFGQLFHFERHMQDGDMVAAAATAPGLSARAMDGADTLLLHTPQHMTGDGGRSGATRRQRPSTVTAPPTKAPHRGARRARWRLSRPAPGDRADSNADGSAEDAEDDATEDEEAVQGSGVMVTSTTTYLTGGAASALPHLQQALLLLKSLGCSIVVCVRDIDVFGIRCDQLLYVLSGLMHDSDGGGGGAGGGGGLSLVLASAAPDIRQLEKRLSSRLTCETRYVPLLPWSLRNLLAATLHTMAQDASHQVCMKEVGRQRADLVATLRSGATKLRQSTEGGGKIQKREQEALKKSMADLEARLHASEATLRELRAQRRHLLSLLDTETVPTTMALGANSAGSPALGYYRASGWRSSALPLPLQLQQRAPTSASSTSSSFTTARTWSVGSLLAHSSLTLEVQCVMCEELLRQLCCATRARQARGSAGVDAACGSGCPALAQLVTELSTELELNSSTSSTVLTVLANHLCKAASGAVDLLGGSGRRVLLSWLRARLRQEPIPPAAASVTSAAQASTTCPAGVPQMILLRWREAAQSMVTNIPDRRAGLAEEAAMNERFVGVDLRPSLALGDREPAATDGANISRSEYHRPPPGLPPLSLLPPNLHDLLADGQLVGMGYGSREVLLVLFYMHIHHTSGVQERTVADLLEDVSSSLGTKAAAALDREAFRHAIRLLCRWRLLRVVEAHSQLLEICGSDARLREFLLTVLSKQPAWCEAELGLDAREIMRFRSLL
ncbi:conserved hypothetical protein [Leishmania infantum JPCM5]|uniref:Uncharacterized protein n=2 Tax=Leishmania infantum TaxID=5671 RepID=A4HXU7_LEIIN|nr:conserved hypothetical protein [Leishmania infantum JPCM5]CAC9480512.1 hypothetical_protein_-_conserved [Leishmania infantum]CAM67125.1 conserved hypothetical protein [Leishmania infantum JPCM5]SUZ40998.1 hypothetical_protein_-_conserved [Leishmania infantum]|eukprot:XP_001464888.1 conserved hypothetical protein [Leishmania infantum JPCM5]